MSNFIISLVDLGLLKEATTCGRKLVRWVDKNKSKLGTVSERLKCEMEAYGALGGQALLQKALSDSSLVGESLACIKRALDSARKSHDKKEIGKDLAQLALWHAFFAPDKTSEIDKLEGEIDIW
jgi:hypothetical protein